MYRCRSVIKVIFITVAISLNINAGELRRLESTCIDVKDKKMVIHIMAHQDFFSSSMVDLFVDFRFSDAPVKYLMTDVKVQDELDGERARLKFVDPYWETSLEIIIDNNDGSAWVTVDNKTPRVKFQCSGI